MDGNDELMMARELIGWIGRLLTLLQMLMRWMVMVSERFVLAVGVSAAAVSLLGSHSWS